MKKTSKLQIVIFTLILFILLLRIKTDIFSYLDVTKLSWDTMYRTDQPVEYPLIHEKLLKQGTYTIKVFGESADTEDRILIYIDNLENKSEQLPEGFFQEEYQLTLEKPLQKIRISTEYNGIKGPLKIESIEISSDYSPQKKKILHHIILAFATVLFYGIFLFKVVYPEKYRRIHLKFFPSDTGKVLIYLLLLTILTSAPFLNSNTIFTNDGNYHMLRIEGIKTSLDAGFFPARIHRFFLNNYGYGEGFYYPDIFLYFPAVLRYLGFSIITVYKIFVAVCGFLALLSITFVVTKITQSKYTGIISATFYAFSAYRLIDIYYRGALGEVQAFIFIPLVVYGIYSIYSKRSKGWIFLSIGLIGLSLTHLIGLALTGLMLILFILLNFSVTLKNRAIFLSLIKAAGLTLLITAFFWLPMLEQISHTEVAGNILFSGTTFEIDKTRLLTFQQLLSGFSDWGDRKPFLGYALLLVPFIRLVIPQKMEINSQILKIGDWILGFGILTMMLTTDIFPWKIFSWLFMRIQFPWRFLLITSPLLAVAGGIYCHLFLQERDRIHFFDTLLCFCLLTSQSFFSEVSSNRVLSSYGFELRDDDIGGAEYLPQNADVVFINVNEDTVLSSDESFEDLRSKRSGLQFSFDFHLSPESIGMTTFEVPLLYYYGYQGNVTDPVGNTQVLEVYQGPHGLTTIETEGITEGTISVFYKKTKVQKIADGISLCTLIICILCYLNKQVSLKARTFLMKMTPA